jgi:hypothetical protein
LPPRKFIQSLQWLLLSDNARAEKPGILHVAGR